MDDPLVRPLPARPLAGRARDWLVWFGIGRVVVVALSVVAVGAGGFWLLRPPPTPVESSLPRATPASSTADSLPMAPTASTVVVDESSTTSTTVALPIVVHVAGHVVAPGVYTLVPGARVVDAVHMAGGATSSAQPDAINLAQPLHDGDRVYVPGVDDASGVPAGVTSSLGTATVGATGSGADAVPVGPVDLNSATVEQLDALPGVGPSTAAAIVAHREANGPFASVDDLDSVRGIGPTKLDALRGLVTV
ncbi:MAG: comEA [Ilumatobacteraceae bacterium]|nr:comEA [Ilumatobacteraceae bacterium]